MPSSNYAEQWILGPLETSFYTRLYMPKDVPIRAAMVFVHGYLEHIGRYETFHSAWAARGVAVFAYDERGFGRTALDEKKSAKSVYGQTGGAVERMLDVQWAIKYTRGKVERVPLFLMGHSMGGGQVLSFATRTESPPDKETVAMLSGVIASSPLVHITKPPPSVLVRLLTMVGKVFPNTVLSTPVQDKELSHDPTIGEDSLKDPWIKGIGTIRGLTDMLNRGALLLSQGYKCWPQDLPVLMLHGTKDMVNSCPSTEKFFEVLQAPDKQLIIYPDMWHDLMTEPAVKEQYFEDCASWLEARIG